VFRPFIAVLAVREARLPLFATFLGALPIGMLSLSVLLLVQSETGSPALAGAVAAAVAAGNAVGLTLQGALLDRWGQTPVLVGSAFVCPSALLLVVLSTVHQLPLTVLFAGSALAGGSIPATTSSMRLLWPRLVADELLRPTAYALMATQFQIALIVGPVLVSWLMYSRGPVAAVVGSAVLSGAGGLLFAAARASRLWRRSSTVDSRGWLSPGVRTLLVTAFAGGVASGVVIVAVPASIRSPFVGVLFAALSLGELLGGLAYGVRASSSPRHLVAGQVATGLAIAGLGLVAPHRLGMVPLMFAIGAAIAPVGITASALLDDVAPPAGLARAYTVMVAVGLVGIALGNWAGGVLSAAIAPGPALLLAAVELLAAAGWTATAFATTSGK
jgi:Major Facilitator Superfamily